MQPLIAGVAAPPIICQGEAKRAPILSPPNCINFGLTAQRACLPAVNEP